VINFAVGIEVVRECEKIRPCYPKEGCELAIRISHFTDAFNITITIDLFDSNDKSGKITPWILICQHLLFYAFKIVDQTTLFVDGDRVYHPKVTPPERGRFTAVLSVADKSIESLLYWNQKTSDINVVANITELENAVRNLTNFTNTLWGMYQDLSEKYKMLDPQVDSKPTAPPGKRNNN
jgi:hypothetical protein